MVLTESIIGAYLFATVYKQTKIFLFNKEKIAIVSWDLYKVTNKINAAIPIIHQVITILDSPIRATINYKNFSKRLN